MANTRMIQIKSMVNKIVGVKLPEYGVNRKWNNKGQVVPLPFDIVEQMLWHEGFRKMIDRGILYIESMKDKIELGLEPEGATEPQNIKALSDIEIKNLLCSQPLSVFKKEISELNMTQIDNIVNYAIENKIVDVEKLAVLGKIKDMDIVKVISTNIESERIEAEEAAKKAAR